MRRDLALLDACARGEIPGCGAPLRIPPACLSLGRMQPMTDVDLEACARDGVDVVRRPSGGRAVLHDQEVTYCGGVPLERSGLRGARARSRARASMRPSPPGWACSAFAPRPGRCPPTSGVTPVKAQRSRTALPDPPLTSCSTIVDASSSAARRRDAPARSSSTARCCSEPPRAARYLRRRCNADAGWRRRSELLGANRQSRRAGRRAREGFSSVAEAPPPRHQVSCARPKAPLTGH